MKIKKNFVTNSSSTSFIVIDETTGKILEEMAKIVWKEHEQNWGGRHKSKDIVRKFLKENPNFNGNVIFPWTINYETFIYKLCPAKVRVDTANNHNWDGLPFERHYCEEFDDENDDYRSNKETFLDLRNLQIKTGKEFRDKEHEKLMESINKRTKPK